MSKDPRHVLGRRGEQLAAEHFERLGFTVVARNHRTRFGELDLVARADSMLVFCEVKTRRAGSSSPWEALHAGKQVQVRRMAAAYLLEVRARPWCPDLRFDAIGITVDAYDGLVSLDHLRGAF